LKEFFRDHLEKLREAAWSEIAGGLDAPCDYSRDSEAMGPIKRSNTRLGLIVCPRST
jgi:hypothetical protein